MLGSSLFSWLGGATVSPAAPLLGAQVFPSVGCPCGAVLLPASPSCRRCPPPPLPSTSLPLSLLPPTPVQPDPCPRAGGPCFVCSPFPPTKSLLRASRLLVLG